MAVLDHMAPVKSSEAGVLRGSGRDFILAWLHELIYNPFG